jgi:hypothetical protein
MKQFVVYFFALYFLYRRHGLKMVRGMGKICKNIFCSLDGEADDLECMDGANEIPCTIRKGAGDYMDTRDLFNNDFASKSGLYQ